MFNGNGTIILRDENLMWVVTPQRGYAETTMYQLEVKTISLGFTVLVDIVDYNPLTHIEQVSKW